jgi:hypothetical protein
VKLAIAIIVAIAFAACTRIVVLSVPPDAVLFDAGFVPDANPDAPHFPDAGNDSAVIGDASLD